MNPDLAPAAPSTIPLSLYLHFPWCVRKCPYCDFNSHALRGELPEDAYIDALLRDLDHELSETPESRPLRSIFMGGGTPSLFSDRSMARLLEQVQRRLAFAPDIEITLEANPGTAEAANFRGYRSAGINRLSIGVQSLDDAQLKRLGRIHNRSEVLRAVDMARSAGFDNFNLDLMFALPEQTPEQAESDLRAALALAPTHLSYYQLTLEPNTEFAARPPPLPDDDTAWTIQQQGQSLLAEAGYAQYEVSAYAQRGRQAQHNLNYWEFGDYLGIGAGAHGKRTGAGGIGPDAHGKLSNGSVRRRARHKHPKTYLQAAGSEAAVQENRRISAAELPFEFLMNALRLNNGFAIGDYEARTGLRWTELAPAAEAHRRGLIEQISERVAPTDLGHRHLNALLTLFL